MIGRAMTHPEIERIGHGSSIRPGNHDASVPRTGPDRFDPVMKVIFEQWISGELD
jgi:hypothetical protein